MDAYLSEAATLIGSDGQTLIAAPLVERDAVTLSHGPIPTLKWGAMTMDFKLRRAVETRQHSLMVVRRWAVQRPEQPSIDTVQVPEPEPAWRRPDASALPRP